MKVWITKYALTEGIEAIDGEIASDISENMFVQSGRTGRIYHGKEWHSTEESAIKRAEEMRIAKIASLKKQIARLEELEFKASSAQGGE